MIDFQQINNDALPHISALLPEILPGGTFHGKEFSCGDLSGTPGNSLKVNIDTGKWSDFATVDKGSDVISLVAAVKGLSQAEAAQWLLERMGISTRAAAPASKKKPTEAKYKTFPADFPCEEIIHKKHGKPNQKWVYYSADEKILGIVCRFDKPEGKKEILPFTYGRLGSKSPQWFWKSWPEPRPLYNLHMLAARPDAPVLFCEGEKAAAAGQRLLPSCVVTTWPGGSSAVEKADFSPLHGRRAAIWPDNDAPGQKAASKLIEILQQVGAAEIHIVDVPPGKPEGWDIADAEKEGWNTEQANAWIKDHRQKIDRAIEAAKDPSLLTQTTIQTKERNKPLPLPELPAVEPFEFELLPETLQPWAFDIADRMQCPADFLAVGFMVAISAVVGRKVGIAPESLGNWIVTPNLWGMIVGRPGALKSPSLEACLAPLKRLEATANEKYSEEIATYQKDFQLYKLKHEHEEKMARKALNESSSTDIQDLFTTEEPVQPVLRRYQTNDSSPQALVELLRHNSNGLMVYRDEIVSLLKTFDREDQAEGRGLYLTGWNGDSSFTTDRIGRGMNLRVEAVCLSLLGGTQPGRLSEYIRDAVQGGAADDGLIQRFGLLVWPDQSSEWMYKDRLPDSAAKNKVFEMFKYLDNLDPFSLGAKQIVDFDGKPEHIPFLRFAPEALELFVEWRTKLEMRLRADGLHPAMESHLSKYRSLIPSLALLIHLSSLHIGAVDRDSTLKALAWGDYLESHAKRAYSSIMNAEVSTAKAILKRLEKGDLSQEFSSRDVWRPGWTGLSDREKVKDGIQLLEEYDYIYSRTVETSGRPATIYRYIGA